MVTVTILVIAVLFAVVGISAAKSTITVDSRQKWNDSEEKFAKGSVVQVTVPDGQTWNDWYITTNAEGWVNTFHVPTRFDGANIFALICCSNEKIDGSCVNIGFGGKVTMTEDGVVSCFANDNEYFYWNNEGSLEVELTIVDQLCNVSK